MRHRRKISLDQFPAENCDVHVLIFINDAPKLEAALHRAFEYPFEYRKINLGNPRREFFYVGLKAI